MSSDALRKTIDRMVEDSIRRILPSVMNEVLIRTIAGSGVMAESARDDEDEPVRRQRKAPKRRKPVREAVKPRKVPPRPLPKRRVELSELLDPGAGADFYDDPRTPASPMQESYEEDHDEVADEEPTSMARRIATLPPALQHLAEGMTLDDDGGEMWGEDERAPSISAIPTDPQPVRDVGAAAQKLGMDFSRMRNVINKTSTAPKVDHEDRQAQIQFKQLQLKRMRENLNGGKPIE